MMISDKAVEAIQQSVQTEVVLIEGREYVTREVFDPPAEPTVRTLTVHTLTGMIDFLTDAQPRITEDTLLLHVVSPTEVHLCGLPSGREKVRNLYCAASAVVGGKFPFERFLDPETFVVNLQSQFVNTETTESILAIIGNLSDATVKTNVDDGVSQSVTIKVGIAREANTEVKNPVELQPFRTFAEIEQPASQYILRLKRGQGNELPTVALFEVVDNRWQLEAIKAIKDFLTGKVSDVPIIA